MTTLVLTYHDVDEFIEELERVSQHTAGVESGIVRYHGRLDHQHTLTGPYHALRFLAFFVDATGRLVELSAPCGGYPCLEPEHEPPVVTEQRERAHDRQHAIDDALKTAVEGLGLEYLPGTLEVRS